MSDTETRIIDCAKKEFLEKGYLSASLRKIVSEAGVTTGAFYGYFRSKEELFERIVGKHYEAITKRYRKAHYEFRALGKERQVAEMGEISFGCMLSVTEYVCQYREEFRILLTASEGTRYSSMISDMAALEEESTDMFIAVLKDLGYAVPPVSKLLEHMVISGFFASFFEIVLHDIPLPDALEYITELSAFYKAGWSQTFGIDI